MTVFSNFVGDLPGDSAGIFALARALSKEAAEVTQASDMEARVDGLAPSWHGESYGAFIESKDSQYGDLIVLLGGTQNAVNSLNKYAWFLYAYEKKVEEYKYILSSYDKEIDSASIDRKLELYLEYFPKACEIMYAYANDVEKVKQEARICAAELCNTLHHEEYNYDKNWGDLGKRNSLNSEDIVRINQQLKDPSPNDVNQNGIGDCYYLADLSAVATTERGRKFLASCVTPHYGEDGKQDGYLVKVYDDPLNPDASACQTVLVTDFYANGNQGEGGGPSWASIYESAYGQLHPGGTKSGDRKEPGFGGGLGTEGFKDITGKEAVQYKNKCKKYFFGLFKEYSFEEKKEIIDSSGKRPMIAGSSTELPGFNEEGETGRAEVEIDGRKRNIQIASGHAYTIISADEDKLVLRNPWGNNNPVSGNDRLSSTFTITWEEFENNFGDVVIGRVP